MYWSPRHSIRSGKNPSTCEKMRKVVTTRRLLRPVPNCGGRKVMFSPLAISLPLICTTPGTFEKRSRRSGFSCTLPSLVMTAGLRITLKESMSMGEKRTRVTSSSGAIPHLRFLTT
jgi:hypothetical protein